MERLGAAIMVSLLVLVGCIGTTARTDAAGQPSATMPTMIDTSGSFTKGFSRDEALRLLELCLNLNNPDDGPAYAADTSAWRPIYPSAADAHADVLGPWHNAWKLWQSNTESNTYAVVIRGTVGEQDSIIDDVIATSVAQPTQLPTWSDGYLDFTLARTPGAETHLGFTYGMAVLMFAQDKGILAQLAKLPADSHIYITGHSQGAAIAALVHAFLHYAINDPADRHHYGLPRNLSLKSYFFAQPKPGNWQFAMDFASIASSRGTSFTVNNTLDWVAQVPLAVEFLDEPGSDLLTILNQTAAKQGKLVQFEALKVAIDNAQVMVRLAQKARARFADITEDISIRSLQQATGLLDRKYITVGNAMMSVPMSINYVGVGNVVPVFGDDPCKSLTSAGPSGDPMCQHHLPTYRALIKAQLSGP